MQKYKQKFGIYSPIKEWDKPMVSRAYDGKMELWKIIGIVALIALGLIILAPMSEAERYHCEVTSTDQSICK